MTISDVTLDRWIAHAWTPGDAFIRVALWELRDARRKLAAVERLADEYEQAGLTTDALFIRIRLAAGDTSTEAKCKHGVTYSHRLTFGPGPMCPGPAALAAGEAPTEPATALIESCVPSGCQCSCHRSLMRVSHMVACCPGPVPQGGTTEQEQQQ